MKKRVIIVHGWEGHPEEGWFPWLRRELEERGFEVTIPQLPDTDNPRIEKWVPALAEAVGQVDENTYFVGHSMGCQAIARYLESLDEDVKVGGAVFVAGFFLELNAEEDEEDVETARLWLEAPIDLAVVARRMKSSVAVFSDNDPDVPLTNKKSFEVDLGSEIIMENGKGHFTEGEGVHELPVVLKAVQKLAGQ